MSRADLDKQLNETANKACDYAFANAEHDFKSLKGGRMCFFPVVEEDDEGIDVGVGLNLPYRYLIYQENGFKSFTMKWAYGKTIPFNVNGKIVYRKCTSLNQYRSGTKNYWQRDENGVLYEQAGQNRSWVHPGHAPVKFMERAVEQAVDEDQLKINAKAIGVFK